MRQTPLGGETRGRESQNECGASTWWPLVAGGGPHALRLPRAAPTTRPPLPTWAADRARPLSPTPRATGGAHLSSEGERNVIVRRAIGPRRCGGEVRRGGAAGRCSAPGPFSPATAGPPAPLGLGNVSVQDPGFVRGVLGVKRRCRGLFSRSDDVTFLGLCHQMPFQLWHGDFTAIIDARPIDLPCTFR